MANNNPDNPPAPGSAEQAINRVLQAERDTDQAVTDCEQQAHTILQTARRRARRILSRTDDRISHMQMRVAQRVTGKIQALDREEKKARLAKPAAPLDETGLAECIEQVASILTGGTPSPDSNGDPDG